MDSKITLNQIREVVREEVKVVVKKELAPIHKTLNKIQKDLKETFDFADRNYLKHDDRIKIIETVLRIPQSL